MMKKILIGIALLIAIIGVGTYYLGANLDSIVRAAVEKYGTAATKTDVTLDKVTIILSSGEASLSGLSVGKPQDFEAKKSLYLGSIEVQIDTKSLTGTGPIVIKSINIDKPQVTYEINNRGESNFQTIMRNTQAYAESVKGGKKEAKISDSADKSGPGRKIIINDLTIRNGQIAISQPMLKGKQLSADLPVIHLTNIGRDEGGTTPADVAQKILGAISNGAAQVASSQLAKELGSNLQKAGEGVGSQIKGLFGN